MDLDVPQNVMPDIMSHHAYHSPDKTALVLGSVRVTWGEMNRRINRVANRLLAAGIARSEKVCFLMQTSLDYFYLMFGAMKAGASAVPLSTLLSPQQIAGLINDAGAVLLFVDEASMPLVAPVLDQIKCVRVDGYFGSRESGRWQSMHAWLEGGNDEEPPVRLAMDDEATISYSSGTTGAPKGVVYSHRARFHLALAYSVHMHIDSGAIGVATTPLYSNGTSIIMFPVLFAGGTLIFMEGFDAEEFQRIVERERATHTFMVPTQFAKLLVSPGLGRHDLSSMRRYVTGGSPMRPDLKQEAITKLGPYLSELYGLSEGGVVMLRPDEMTARPDAAGLPLPGFEVRIIGMDDRELPRGEVGEIIFYGGWAMRRYHNNPQRTEEVIWRDGRGRSFIRSGDIGKMDRDGYVYVVDRKKDMIISGGFNIFPADIEAVVGAYPGVLDVAVIGVAHPVWGESPLAVVVLRPGASIDPEALRAWANERLAKTQRVAAVVLRDDFPRNALGKVQKPQLREEFRNFELQA